MNRHLSAVLLLVIGFAGASAQTQKPAAPSTTPVGNAVGGKQVFAAACASCHGGLAKGSDKGPPITPPPARYQAFVTSVRQPSGAMLPVDKATVSDTQLADVYAFLRSLSSPGASAAPAGTAENGKHLFVTKGCYECHGYVAQGGGGGPKLGPHPISLAAVIAECRHPRSEMPPYTSKVLSDAELTDIYAFLQALPEPPDASGIAILK
jgi:mono/diheme cytochrome c family protein